MLEIQLDNMEKYIPKPADVFKWCDEEYICIESTSLYGLVNPVGETYYLRSFMWNYENEPQVFMRELTEKEREKIFGNE